MMIASVTPLVLPLVLPLLLAATPPAPPSAATAPEPTKVSWSSELKLPSLAGIDAALAEPLRDSWEVILHDKSVRPVKTCKDVLAVAKVEFDLPPDHSSDSDWNSLVSQSIRCFALDALKSAKPASASYLRWFTFNRAGIGKLPAGFSLAILEDEAKQIAKAEKACKPWGKYDPQLKVKVDGTNDGAVDANGWAGRVTLYARGDLDGDGNEDLMLYRYGQVEGGGATDETVFIVTQTSAKGCPRIIRRLPESFGKGTQAASR